ncbi:COG complex component COG2 C-terminal [Trinorchestia longiramus]|nr:COG complex component COG2 C-terminal [Trinorchestia longiramus]
MTDLQKQDAVLKYKKKLSTLSVIAKRLDSLEELISRTGLDSEAGPPRQTECSDTSQETPGAGEANGLHNLCVQVCSPEELLNRLAAELSLLNYLGSTCEGTRLMTIYKPRLERIKCAVEASIEKNFTSALGASFGTDSGSASCNTVLLRRTLVAAVVLDRPSVVQRTLRELLSPLIRQALSEESLRSNPRGLAGLMSSLLAQLEVWLEPLLVLSVPRKYQNRSELLACVWWFGSCSTEEVPGLQFIERSVFPEVVTALSRLPDFYSPANPTAFHQRYVECMALLERLELMLVTRERVEQFRALDEHQKFLDLWNLAVYFQIRNQEIRQVVESSLCEEEGVKLLRRDTAAPGSGEGLQLCSTRGVVRGVEQCWLPDVFLPPLLHRFWKLTLLVLSRHRTWLAAVLRSLKSGGGDILALASSSKPDEFSSRPTSVVQLSVALLSDLRQLVDHINSLYDQHIAQHTHHLDHKYREMMTNALRSESSQLQASERTLEELVCSDVATAVTSALQPVTDTPRLYRRTNRAAPTEPQPYVNGAALPVLELQRLGQSCLRPECLHACYASIIASVALQFNSLTSEVLENVSKTEESLRRLKRARGNTAVTAQLGSSDEDKIREQLHLDVQHFGQQLSGVYPEVGTVPEFVQLTSVVSAARTAATAAPS